jgi:hypothetical protein
MNFPHPIASGLATFLGITSIACSSASPSASATAAASGGDSADHACNVVLYEAKVETTGSTPPVFPIHGAGGKLWWPFTATVHASGSLPADATVGLLYSVDGATWKSAKQSQATDAGTAGFTIHIFEFGEGLLPFSYDASGEVKFGSDGLEIPQLAGKSVEVVPFVTLPDGTTLFDHNQNRGDFDNYRVAAGDHWDATGPSHQCFHW